MPTVEDICIAENKIENSEQVHDAPSGKYRLIVTSYKSVPGG
jgi:hypothetical protein